LAAAPHGVAPQNYPVFSKPIYNLKGMGVGSRALFSPEDYASAYQPGHFWTTLLEGDHVSSDVALVDGEPQWWRHATGVASGAGTFDLWEVHAVPSPAVEDWCGAWCRRHLKGYTGPAQSRDHRRPHHRGASALRRSVADLYGADGWRRSSVSTHRANGGSTIRRGAPDTASFCSCRTAGDTDIRRPNCRVAIRGDAGVSSVQITFHEELPPGPACHAAGRLSRCHRQLLGSRRRRCGARATARPTSRRRRLRSRSYAAGSRRTG
jgi:hypothetical protein